MLDKQVSLFDSICRTRRCVRFNSSNIKSNSFNSLDQKCLFNSTRQAETLCLFLPKSRIERLSLNSTQLDHHSRTHHLKYFSLSMKKNSRCEYLWSRNWIITSFIFISLLTVFKLKILILFNNLINLTFCSWYSFFDVRSNWFDWLNLFKN